MNQSELTPRWMRELVRLSSLKTQLYLYGNIKDTVLYPLGPDHKDWSLGPLREALFEVFRQQFSGYAMVGAYNVLDGLVFADARDDNQMGEVFDAVVDYHEKEVSCEIRGRSPQPAKPQDQLEQTLQHIRVCLANRQYPCVFILEHASQLLTNPTMMQASERTSFLRLLKASGESQLVAVERDGARHVVQNLLVVLCDKLTDLPAWLFLNNPFTAGIEIEAPRSYERRHFFDLYLSTQSHLPYNVDELVDLSEGMTVRDLCGIRGLARRSSEALPNSKALIDCFKYGVRESEWDNLDWKRLESAEEILSQRVLGQPAAVSAVADTLRRARLHLSGSQHSSRTKPRGVLFFAGPTGVGKTELAKAVAELVFRTEDACIRFDMSEYSQPNADQRLLGAPPGYVGYEEGGQLTNRVKSNPFSVLLFDEIEKAHPSILDKFLQILEDGRMTDGRGETVYFSESVIIFTSNIGIYQLDQSTGRPLIDPFTGHPILQVDPNIDLEYAAVQTKVLEGVQNFFKHFLGRPELLNRIGQNIIVFDYIRQQMMQQILERKVLRSIQSQVKERWKINVEFSSQVVAQLMEVIGNDISSGGRGIGNLAEIAIVNPLARTMFSLLGDDEPDEGKTIVVTDVIRPDKANSHRYDITWEVKEAAGASA